MMLKIWKILLAIYDLNFCIALLVVFYGLSTLMGYLMPNPVYILPAHWPSG